MRNISAVLSLLLILGLIYYSFFSLMPQQGTPASLPQNQFSTERALVPLKEISKAPHYYSSSGHETVHSYLVQQLKDLGAETQSQEGYVGDMSLATVANNDSTDTYSSGFHLIKPKNIVARIKGSENGKALLLLSHYDSAMIPSYGASDAGSGVVTILESMRAFLSEGKTPKNDIIILFTDAEEVGLDGARLFVEEHPWAKDVGLVLNFEARGSGGPSNMILETNQGNANLVKNFVAANPEFPVASSLMYSVYKMLPNDTDSTIFRQEGDIDSFFFAFIDDHFDYHTANDTYENLDRETLQHQGSYLLPLVHYFANTDLSQLKAEEDYVYVNAPFVKMISYPFSWILWMLLIATVLFIILIFYGISKKKLVGRTIARGFGSFLIALIVSGLIGFFGWKALLWLYPQYTEIQHGFTYNGHWYIAFFVMLTIAICFKIYKRYSSKEYVAGLYVAPLVFWILINVAVFVILKGAGYFIIPVFFGLLSFWMLIKQEKPNLLILGLLAAPAIFLFGPLIQFFPVGLGLKMLVISAVFTVLTFGLLIPVFAQYRWKNILSAICLLLAIAFFIIAHFKSDFSEKRQKPNSLIYYQNADDNNAYWLTYDTLLDEWTKGYLGESPEEASEYVTNAASSKYNSGYTYAAKAPQKQLENLRVKLHEDSINDGDRTVRLTLYPKRKLNRLQLYMDKNIQFKTLSFNGKSGEETSKKYLNKRMHDGLVRFYIAENDSLEMKFSVSENTPLQFTTLAYSYDLMTHPQFSIAERGKDQMPRPFVVTDAIVVKKSFDIDDMSIATDSLSPNILTPLR